LNSPSTLLFYPPPIPEIVSTDIIFAFTYMCTQFFAMYSPSYTLFWPPPLLLLVPTSTPPHRTCSALLFSDFVEAKRKKRKK
jgi:hypothetical protein